jgi:hypothetical protein
MSRIHSLLGSRHVALAFVLLATALAAGCGTASLTGPGVCDPRDPRSIDWTRELAPDLEGDALAPCQPSMQGPVQ